MTKLSYILYDGTETTSYIVAELTGKPYVKRYTPVCNVEVDEKLRAKRLAKLGYKA